MKSSRPHEKEAIQKLAQMIRGIEIAMLTTIHEAGTLRSRPMAVQKVDFDGDLWFFTRHDSPKTHEVEEDPRVNVSFSEPKDQKYVSVTGEAELVRDRKKAEQLWNPAFKAWFPDGLDDPDLVLLRIHVDHAEYWDMPSKGMVYIAGFVKSLASGREFHPGENRKVDLAG
jgi:general stress protein 26